MKYKNINFEKEFLTYIQEKVDRKVHRNEINVYIRHYVSKLILIFYLSNREQLEGTNEHYEQFNFYFSQKKIFFNSVLYVKGYGPLNATNTLKHSLIGQFAKFFLLNGQRSICIVK